MDNLYDKLKQYHQSGIYPCHMPGHKRNMQFMPMADAYAIDLTEIEGLDNLYHAKGILKDAMVRTARLYHAQETHFLVNGSTGGILSAIAACVRRGGTLLLARNSHRSAYHALMQSDLRGVYLYPQYDEKWQIAGGITPESVRAALQEHTQIQAVFITSPTYEGIVSHIGEIAKEVHRHGIPLIVDEAHGAHFGLDWHLPASAVSQGADIVVQSLHKTLPAFTQTALLHVNGERVDRERLKRYLAVYQTSSPSYVLMAGIDQCIALLTEKKEQLFAQFYEKRTKFLEKIKQLKHIRIINGAMLEMAGTAAVDDCKLIISVYGTNCTGQKLYGLLLRQYGLQMEMAASTYVLAVLTIMDTEEGFDRLAKALLAIDEKLCALPDGAGNVLEAEKEHTFLKAVSTIAKAVDDASESRELAACAGMAAAEYVFVYPPGIPLIVPGEVFTPALIGQIMRYQKEGLHVCGIDKEKGTVNVIKL